MFGMSVFQSVLERLKAEEETPEEASADSYGLGIHGVGFVAGATRSVFADNGSVQRAYFDMAAEVMPAPPRQKPVMPAHLGRTAPRDIAAELAIDENDTASTLTAKRRAFAAENHPDRHLQEFCANATIRMKIANMLIDEALRQLRLLHRA